MRKFVLNLFGAKNEDEKKKGAAHGGVPNAWMSDAPSAAVAAPNAVIDCVEDGDGTEYGSGAGKTFFGVKSYLNYFYLSSTSDFDGANFVAPQSSGASPTNSGGVWYLLPPPPARRRAARIFYAFCRALSVIGLLLLLSGALAIVVGYCWPSLNSTLNRLNGDALGAEEDSESTLEASLMRIAIDQDDEGNFYIPPERFAELLRDPMHAWKITGFCMFAIGGSLMALSLLVTSSACGAVAGSRLAIFSDAPPSEPPIRIYPGGTAPAGAVVDPSKFHIVPTRRAASNRISPTSGPVPGFEEISKVQPSQLKKSPSTPTPSADELLLLDGIASKGDDSRPLLPPGTKQ